MDDFDKEMRNEFKNKLTKALKDKSEKEKPKMTGKTLTDLNDSLFNELERLSNASDSNLENEVERSKAITNIATKIIDNAKLSLDAKKYIDEMGGESRTKVPLMLSMEKNETIK